MGGFYHPECARGVRWDDPALGIAWPLPDSILSEKDRTFSDEIRKEWPCGCS